MIAHSAEPVYQEIQHAKYSEYLADSSEREALDEADWTQLRVPWVLISSWGEGFVLRLVPDYSARMLGPLRQWTDVQMVH